MIIRNEDIREISMAIPEGHRHIRATVLLADGNELTFQEATIANLVRAYITVKTHPETTTVRLTGKKLERRKEGYAEWQLIEEEDRLGGMAALPAPPSTGVNMPGLYRPS